MFWAELRQQKKAVIISEFTSIIWYCNIHSTRTRTQTAYAITIIDAFDDIRFSTVEQKRRCCILLYMHHTSYAYHTSSAYTSYTYHTYISYTSFIIHHIHFRVWTQSIIQSFFVMMICGWWLVDVIECVCVGVCKCVCWWWWW